MKTEAVAFLFIVHHSAFIISSVSAVVQSLVPIRVCSLLSVFSCPPLIKTEWQYAIRLEPKTTDN